MKNGNSLFGNPTHFSEWSLISIFSSGHRSSGNFGRQVGCNRRRLHVWLVVFVALALMLASLVLPYGSGAEKTGEPEGILAGGAKEEMAGPELDFPRFGILDAGGEKNSQHLK